jgi:hypothetical protein
MEWKYLSLIEISSTSYICQSPAESRMIIVFLPQSTHCDRPDVTKIYILAPLVPQALALYSETSLLLRCKSLEGHPQLSKVKGEREAVSQLVNSLEPATIKSVVSWCGY